MVSVVSVMCYEDGVCSGYTPMLFFDLYVTVYVSNGLCVYGGRYSIDSALRIIHRRLAMCGRSTAASIGRRRGLRAARGRVSSNDTRRTR